MEELGFKLSSPLCQSLALGKYILEEKELLEEAYYSLRGGQEDRMSNSSQRQADNSLKWLMIFEFC